MSIAPEQSAPEKSFNEHADDAIRYASSSSRRLSDLPEPPRVRSEKDKPLRTSGGFVSAVTKFDKEHPVITRAAVATGLLVGAPALVAGASGAFRPASEVQVVAEDSKSIEQKQIMAAMDATYDPSLRVGEPIVVVEGETRLYGEALARISNEPGYAANEDTILDVINKSTLSVGTYQAGEVYSVYPVDLNGDNKLEYIVKEEKGQLTNE